MSRRTGASTARPVGRRDPAPPTGSRRSGPSDESKSVRSPWVWRAFAMMALVALGLVVTFAADGVVGYAVAWAIIALAWTVTAGLLWRAHLRVT